MKAELRNDPEIESLAPDHEASTSFPMSNFAKRLSAVWWPAFLMAGAAEMLVFAFVDPEDLRWLGGAPVDLDRTAVYTAAFFAFWVLIGIASSLTQLLMRESNDLNRRRYP